MATSNVIQYTPGKTLGRSGYAPTTSDLIYERARQLDALLCLITSDDGEEIALHKVNQDIQAEVLHLASSLATEINELNEKAFTEREGVTHG